MRFKEIAAFLAPAAPLVVAGIAFWCGALHAAPIPEAPGGSLSVTVTDLHSTKGQLIACLWRDKPGFPSCEKSRTAHRVTLPVTATTMRLAFPGVAPGAYAVTVIHDEDGDGKTRHNFIGMPMEGVGISNNPGGMPGFDKSLVQVGQGSAITVRMKYLFG